MDNTFFVNKEFISHESENAYIFDKYFGLLANDAEGSILYGYDTVFQPDKHQVIDLDKIGACFGYVIDSGKYSVKVRMFDNSTSIPVRKGQWFSTESGLRMLLPSNAKVLIIQKIGYKGIDSVSKVEEHGRLKYIDGCSDSLLYYPPKYGDPCLNALFMPEGVNQTMHTHPSTRMGCIFSGYGNAVTPSIELDLQAGNIFYLKTEQAHKFRTDRSGQYMKIIAYHPDSDFGPKDEEHPMVNRTYVDGISAKEIPRIQTKEIFTGHSGE